MEPLPLFGAFAAFVTLNIAGHILGSRYPSKLDEKIVSAALFAALIGNPLFETTFMPMYNSIVPSDRQQAQ